jgi:hypothetical protein
MMNTQRIAVGLAVSNAALLALLLLRPQIPPALAASSQPEQQVVPLMRVRQLELVDERGTVRAQLMVAQPGDEVLLRMRSARGLIRVKLGANEAGSGLVLADSSQQPGLTLHAKSTGSSVRVMNRDGGERELKP